MIKETHKKDFCQSRTCFKWYSRFKESVALTLDDTGRGSKPNVTEKKLTLISDHLDEDKLQTLLHSLIRDSIWMSTNNGYSHTSNSLLSWGNILRRNELKTRS